MWRLLIRLDPTLLAGVLAAWLHPGRSAEPTGAAQVSPGDRGGRLCNTAISWHRTTGPTNIARATGQANRRSHDLITAVNSSYPTTQGPWHHDR
jgi:hypothetical protein